MKSEPRSVSMKSEPVKWAAPRSAPPPAPRSMPEYYRDLVPAKPTGTHHQHDSPFSRVERLSARAMSEDSSRISMHSSPRTPPRDGGSVHSSSIKSERPPSIKSERPPSIKSERPPSVKMEPRRISLPGSSVGASSIATSASGAILSRSIKSESETQGMVGSYSGSHRGSLGSRSSYNGGSKSAS